MRTIFFGPRGLRAGWRFAIFAVLWIAISNGLLLAARAVYSPHRGMHPVDFVVSDGLSLVAVFVVLAIFRRVFRWPAESGLAPSRGVVSRFGAGLVWGLAPVAVTMAAIAVLGGVSFRGWTLPGAALVPMTALWIATMIVLGLFEEALFRGYALATLGEGIGAWPAAIVLSSAFGALHFLLKPGETVLDAVSVALIGLFLCLTIFRTGDLWLAVGFHASFDFFALAFFGAPNTGNGGQPLEGHLLATSFHGPVWLTGGPCGIEASVPMVIVTLLLFPAFAWRHGGVVARPAEREAATEATS